MPVNLFQTQLDSVASPLLTTPSTPKLRVSRLPGPGAGTGGLSTLPSTPGLPDVSGLLGGLGLGGALGGAGSQVPARRPAVRPQAPGRTLAPRQPASVPTGPRQPTIPASPDTTLQTQPSAGHGWVQAVAQVARQSGIPEQNIPLAIAIALEESGGDPHAIGDSGSSYGLFQLHKGGALGNLSQQQAFDPATNAGPVLRAWGKLGGGRGLDPRAALMQYYSQVGRGSSNEIPTQRAYAKLAEARGLLGGAGGAPAPAGQTLMERTMAAPVGGMDPKTMSSLVQFALGLNQQALGGHAPSLESTLAMAGPILASISQRTPSGSPRTVDAPVPAPTGSGPTGGPAKLIGLPHQGTHNLGNWESDNAVDIAVPVGTPLYATTDGTIGSQFGSLNSNNPRMLGLRLHLDGPQESFYYAHMSRFAPGIQPGSQVRAGQLLGYSGSANGVSHLHFASEHRDPRDYVG